MEILDDIGRGELALEASDGKTHNLVAGSRHLLHFHAAFGTDKEYLGIVPTCLDCIGYRHCGENVSAASSSTDDDFHILMIIMIA